MCVAVWTGCPTGLGQAARRPCGGPAAPRSSGHPQSATGQAGDHPLVNPAAGPRAGREPRHTIARIWREYGVQPWRAETFKFSTDPQLAAKVHDVVGLYLHPPERAVVLCMDEKSQIQALERTQPVRRVWLDRPEQRTHDYIRHGTTTLFAALEVATGRVTNHCAPRHRHQEFLAFLKQVARAYPRRRLHVICDNYATHKHPVVRGWLTKHPRVELHFTPTSASWLNLVEVFFSIVDRQALRRGDFPSVEDLTTAISRFCQSWNEHCQPFSWTKPADEILAKLNRKDTSATEH
jgi:transposase